MLKLIPTNDPKQALRIRRFFLAATGYVVWMIIIAASSALGLSRTSPAGLALSCGLMFLSLFIFYVFLRTGFNKRFKDPSMTIAQMVIACFWVGVTVYFSEGPIRGSIIALYVVIFVFGIFRLSLPQFFILVAVAGATYASAVCLLHHHHPGEIDPFLEVIRTSLLLVALLWFSLIGHYIQRLRRKVVRTNTELQNALKKIEHLAIHDELTGVYNRRHLVSILEREKALADRTGVNFAVCLLDLDDFKQINDTYGHLAGDIVLKEFAQAIRKDIRKEDYVARYGGEEFIVLFTGTRCVDNGTDCALRMQSITRRLTFADINPAIRLTVSIGMTIYRLNESIDDLLTRADTAMYQAKKSGKDRVEYL
ncbi:MAG: GGDEF domain-containing protein [Thermodesulfobacteriota bacterium]